jgi:hypothetical protein
VAAGYAAIPSPSLLYTQWETYLTKLTDYVARQFWDKHILDHKSEIGGFLRGSRNTKYVSEVNGTGVVDGVLVANDGDRQVVVNVAGRVTSSRGKFNDFFAFSPKTGCQRT